MTTSPNQIQIQLNSPDASNGYEAIKSHNLNVYAQKQEKGRKNKSQSSNNFKISEPCLTQERIHTISGYCSVGLAISLFCFQLGMQIAIMVKGFAPGIVSSNDIAGGVTGVYENLGSAPLSDIVLASSCPGGYEKLSLGEWPGLKRFCYYKGYFILDNGKCTVNLQVAVDPQTYNFWKTNSVCGKRMTTTNTSACASGFLECSPGVCVQGDTCGITEIHFENATRTDPGWYSSQFGNISINYRRDTGVLPITELKISHGQPTLCVNPYEYTTQINYPAISTAGNGCGRYGSFPAQSALDNDTSLNILYSQNWQTKLSDLPEFESRIGSQLGYLVAIQRLGLVKKDICTSLNLEEMMNRSQDLQNSRNVSAGISITNISLIGVMVIFGLITLCLIKKFENIFLVMVVFSLVLTTIIGILIIPAAAVTSARNSSLSAYKDTINEAISNNCFNDAGVQLLLSDFVETTDTAGQVASLWVIFAIVWWVAYLAFIISMICYHKTE